MTEDWIYNDGGRAEFGSVATAGDCACRAIAIATGTPYGEVYRGLTEIGGRTPRNGTARVASTQYLESRGWRVHTFDEPSRIAIEHLPMGRMVLILERHMVAVIDRVIHDTYDPRSTASWTSSGTTCVPATTARLAR